MVYGLWFLFYSPTKKCQGSIKETAKVVMLEYCNKPTDENNYTISQYLEIVIPK